MKRNSTLVPIVLIMLFVIITVAQILFIALRISGEIDWSWYLVMLPINYYVFLAYLYIREKFWYIKACSKMDNDPGFNNLVDETMSRLDQEEHSEVIFSEY